MGVSSFIFTLAVLVLLHLTEGQFKCGTTPALSSSKLARIFGGKGVRYGEFPWQINLYENGRRKCGATLVHQKWIISAGHCIITKLINQNTIKVYTAVAGDHDITKDDAHEQFRYVIKAIVHPDFEFRTYVNDIAILEVDFEFEFNNYVLPACLPWFDETPFPYTQCTVTGWGFINPVEKAKVLHKVELPVLLQKVCELIHHEGTGTVHLEPGMICAGYLEGKKDSCQGDSGGPMVCPRYGGGRKAEKVLTGIVSWGKGCGVEGQAGVYTSIASYADWINETLKTPPTYNDDPCMYGGVRIQNVKEGSISSPGYRKDGRGVYPSAVTCNWEIDLSSFASPTSSVVLSFDDFDVEQDRAKTCKYDYFKLYVGEGYKQLIGTYCGDRVPDDVILTRSRTDGDSPTKFKVVFNSDFTVGRKGFHLNFKLT